MDDQLTAAMLVARRDMIAAARHIIDEARSRAVVLRLYGGLAVRSHCELAYVCERDYSDIDLIGLRSQVKEILALFAALGYEENRDVRIAASGSQLQVFKPCAHPGGEHQVAIHADDHVDVFLDAFHMDHTLLLAERLEIEDYTISLSDLLLTKLQAAHLDEKDERDIVSLIGQAPLGDSDARGTVNVAYIARLCARDWGLHHDVLANIGLMYDVLERRDDLELQLALRVRASLDYLAASLEAEPKSTKWKLRAKVGTHRAWHDVVDDQDDEGITTRLPGE